MGGSLLAFAGFLGARSRIVIGWVIATASVLPLGTYPAFTGHAAGAEELRSLALTADTLHVLAAGGWIGLLALVVYLEWRWRRDPDTPVWSLPPSLVPAFSPIAMACVVTLLATGTFAAWLHLPSLGALASTSYGRTLVLKLVLVGVVLALGAVNYRVLTPRLGSRAGNQALRRAATVEVLVAQVVLFVTAMLVRTPPM